MNQRNQTDQTDQRDQIDQMNQRDEINLLDYWRVVWKWRRLIIIGTLTCMVVAGLLGLSKTRVYKSQATFFTTKGQGGRIVQTGDRVSMAPDSQEIRGDLLIQMAKSSEVAQRVIKDLNLTTLWKTKRQRDCELILSGKMKIGNVGQRQSEIYNLSITDKDPQLAFKIAESYLKNLQEVNNEINANTVQNFLKFVEDKVTQTRDDLTKTEEELKDFKIKYGIASLQKQSETTVQGIADFQLEIAKTETQLSVLEKQYTRNDPEVIRTRTKIAELKQKIRQFQGGGILSTDADLEKKDRRISSPTISDIPNLAVKMGELEQKVQIQNDIYKLLTVQYESAKIEATKVARIIQVIDKPVIPEDPEPRKIKQNTMIAGIVGLMLTVMMAFLLEYILKNRNQLSLPKRFNYALTKLSQ